MIAVMKRFIDFVLIYHRCREHGCIFSMPGTKSGISAVSRLENQYICQNRIDKINVFLHIMHIGLQTRYLYACTGQLAANAY